MLKIIFILAVAVTGLTDWLKNLLPGKVKDNKIFMSLIAGGISAVTGLVFVLLAKPFGFNVPLTWQNILIYVVGVVGLVQVSYTVLLQTFKGVVERLKSKAPAGSLSPDELTKIIEDKITELLAKKK